MRRKFEFALDDFLVDLNRLIGVERRKTLEENEGESEREEGSTLTAAIS